MLFRKKIFNLFEGEFAKNVMTLMMGTTIAQAIPILASIVLARLYSPDDFGVLAVFMAITAITGVISNAKYEQAVVLPEKEEDAINLVVLGVVISIIVSLVLFLIVLLFGEQIAVLLDEKRIENYLFLVPLSTFFLGIYKSLNFYNIRHKEFRNVSVSNITKSSSLALTQIGVGLIYSSPFGLILGQIMSYFSGNFILFRILRNQEDYQSKVNKQSMINLAKKYKKFPLFSMPAVFINSINLNLINFLIPAFFSMATLGFYSFTQRIVGIPVRVIGGSFSQVYFQKATAAYNCHGNTRKIFLSTLKKLVLIALPIFTIMFFLSEPLFAFVFGEKWRIAGYYAQILTPLAFVRFLSGSLSNTIVIHEKQQIGLIINVVLLVSTLGLFLLGRHYGWSFEHLLLLYSFIIGIEYGLFLLKYYQITIK